MTYTYIILNRKSLCLLIDNKGKTLTFIGFSKAEKYATQEEKNSSIAHQVIQLDF